METPAVEISPPLLQNDAVVFGLLMVTLAVIFVTSQSQRPFFQKFYKYVPALLLCYFIPGLYNTFNVVSSGTSGLYHMASRYLLPASLVLLTLSIDLKEIRRMGIKLVVMFLTGTVGIILGGPLAIWIVSLVRPQVFAQPEVWRGLSTIAGSWIGGGANQAAMYAVFTPSARLFSQMVAVDVIIANIWMGFILYWSNRPGTIDRFLRADSSEIQQIQKKLEDYHQRTRRIPTLTDLMKILGICFGITGLAHFCADRIAPFLAVHFPDLEKYSLTSPFFWIVVIATTGGLILSFTRARKLEGVGASRVGSAFLYVLIATIGMSMNLKEVLNTPGFFLVGAIWILTHITFMILIAYLIKAPFFYVAVGSQANIGGAASAPVVASAFHPSLAPVGVLVAVLGYALGTYGAYFCGILMKSISQLLHLVIFYPF